MQTLIIYDSEGYIISQMSGDVREPVGIPFMWVEVPEGKRIVSINPETNEPIFEDLPVPEIQQLRDQVDASNVAMAQMLGM
ncbi:MAG TPA: hypothetical protein DEP17_03545 [Lachnospiraceae bacterium]|jgi:hypothetical protein|nr:hypothetical protein [Lachnospiraceae bacterium]HCM12667.1 hypothetical protein [Lachnospiraceae bacterium]HCR40630.1 hypothetical protein [Lachnospiraceae bacterium]